jgi:hypothetical protein
MRYETHASLGVVVERTEVEACGRYASAHSGTPSADDQAGLSNDDAREGRSRHLRAPALQNAPAQRRLEDRFTLCFEAGVTSTHCSRAQSNGGTPSHPALAALA